MVELKLDKSSDQPLYIQLANQIRTSIRSGALLANAKLPTEEELCTQLSLSRPVVRHAYKLLIEEQLIYRNKALGTFVRGRMDINDQIWNFTPLTQQIIDKDESPSVEILKSSFVAYDDKHMSGLELSKKDYVYYTERLYFGNSIPTFYTILYFPYVLLPGIEQLDLKHGSLSKIIFEHYHLKPHRTRRILKAVILPDFVCKSMQLSKGSSGFLHEITSYLEDGRPLEYSKTYTIGLTTQIEFNYFDLVK